MASTISANSAGGGGLVTSGDASGVLNLQTASVTALSIDASQKVTFTNSLTSPTLTSPIIAGTPTGVGVLTSGTAQASTSGTSIDFTGIPSWAKRITMVFQGVSTNAASTLMLQLGAGTTPVSTGYVSSAGRYNYAGGTAGAGSLTATGLYIAYDSGAADIMSGTAVLTLIGSNTWVCSGSFSLGASGSSQGNGYLSLGGVLDRVRVTTLAGTDNFDAGSINIMYE